MKDRDTRPKGSYLEVVDCATDGGADVDVEDDVPP